MCLGSVSGKLKWLDLIKRKRMGKPGAATGHGSLLKMGSREIVIRSQQIQTHLCARGLHETVRKNVY